MYISAIAFTFAALFPGYLAYLEIVKKPIDWLKVSILSTLFCGFLGFGIYDILKKATDSGNDKNDIIKNTDSAGHLNDSSISLLNPKLDSAGKKLDSTREDIKMLSTSRPDSNEAPLLDVYSLVEGDLDPVVRSTSTNDSFVLAIKVENAREFEAYPVLEKIVFCKYDKKKKIEILDYDSRIPNNSLSPIYFVKQHISRPLIFYSGFEFPNNRLHISDTLIICFELMYKNKYGRVQKPLQKVYAFYNGRENRMLIEEQNYRTIALKNWLARKGYW